MFKIAVLAVLAVAANAQLSNWNQRPQRPAPIPMPEPIADKWRDGRLDARCDFEYGPNDKPKFLTVADCASFEKCNGGYACKLNKFRFLKISYFSSDDSDELLQILLSFLGPFTCPADLMFDAEKNVCALAEEVNCNGRRVRNGNQRPDFTRPIVNPDNTRPGNVRPNLPNLNLGNRPIQITLFEDEQQ